MDKIEILLATYNGEKYIAAQLDSIINQTYTNWIITVSDDNSKDNTYNILMDYQERYPDKITVKRNNPGFGSAKANFMNLIRESKEKYVMCCDQDDVWLPNKVALSYEKMKQIEENGVPTLIHTDLKVVDSNLSIMSDSFFEYSKLRKNYSLKDNMIQNFVTGCTIMLNRTLVDIVKQADNCTNIMMHDWWISLAASTFGKVGFVDQPTMLYRQHAVNSVGAKRYGVSLFISKLKENKMRQSVENTCSQAKYFLDTYKDVMSTEHVELYSMYASLFHVSKIKRVNTYFKSGFWKNGFARKVCQIIFC